jgi:glycosyltransferase involved in cell wall biosynthesis
MHTANEASPELSALTVTGACRRRAQRVLDALSAQTAADKIEVIVIDLADSGMPDLIISDRVKVVYIRRPGLRSWARARIEGVRHASAPVVAFIEDHCFPATDWAEVLIETHRGPWAAVGYAFTNANPETYASRAGIFADYAPWAHPARHGQAELLPGNNVSYKRDLLLSLGDRLEAVIAPDFNLHEEFRRRGLPMFVESRALAAHENFVHISGLLKSNHYYCRLLAANRAASQRWGMLRRLAYGFGVPLGAPGIKFLRLLESLRGRRVLWPAFVASLPVLWLCYLWAAAGESAGYLFGAGSAEAGFHRWELEAEREVM